MYLVASLKVYYRPKLVLSKNKIKLIRSLDLKKNRLASGLFVAEGEKLILDLLQSEFKVLEVFCLNDQVLKVLKIKSDITVNVLSKEELSRISFLKTTPEIIALCRIPESSIDWDDLTNNLSIFLDEIQDPGNLGTIVRLADWFGIGNIICSEGCADLFNPKVIQSTMGAFARVNVHYVALTPFLEHAQKLNIPIYGTYMGGENLFTCKLSTNGIIVMGNEGNGISEVASLFINRKITIPSFPPGVATSESLNVAIATSVICAEFRRRIICKD